MNFLSLLDSLLRLASTVVLDDSSLALLALLAGMGGGWTLTLLQEQRKVKKVRIDRKQDARRRSE